MDNEACVQNTNENSTLRSSRIFPIRYNKTKGWYYTVTNSFLSAEECQDIIKWANTKELPFATTVGEDKPSKSIRIAQTTTVPDDIFSWLYDRLAKEIILINDLNYHYDITGLFEPIYLLKYKVHPDGLKGKYDWHTDGSDQSLRQRKISSIIQLSDPANYEGCQLEIEYSCEGLPCTDKNQGTLITFPSYKSHRITPITKGERYSLVCWVSGPAFR